MRIVVSDTHLAHGSLGPLTGDVLIHCGDFALGPGARDDDIERLEQLLLDWNRVYRYGVSGRGTVSRRRPVTILWLCIAFVAGTFFGVFAVGLGQAAAAGDRLRSR